jgi:3-oxoacyl-[acyl-carrier protein] reductase
MSADAAAPTDPLSLRDRVAFVTGSSRGIGWATACLLARHGASVVLNGRDEARLAERAEELEASFGVRALSLAGDVSSAADVKGFYARIFQEFKRLDVLVNNAGIFRGALLGMIGDELLESTMAVNATAVVRHMQAAVRLMARSPRGGSIINLTSILGVRGGPGQVAYAASKAAVVGATLAAAKELAEKNVRVNAVAPGAIDTEMLAALPPQQKEALSRSIGMKRLGSAEDVAKVVLFLAGDLSTYVTGQVIGVDGGMIV